MKNHLNIHKILLLGVALTMLTGCEEKPAEPEKPVVVAEEAMKMEPKNVEKAVRDRMQAVENTERQAMEEAIERLRTKYANEITMITAKQEFEESTRDLQNIMDAYFINRTHRLSEAINMDHHRSENTHILGQMLDEHKAQQAILKDIKTDIRMLCSLQDSATEGQ
jgi:uncharacterized lipoprotein YajG